MPTEEWTNFCEDVHYVPDAYMHWSDARRRMESLHANFEHYSQFYHRLILRHCDLPSVLLSGDTANIVAAYLGFDKQWTTGGTLLLYEC